MKLQLKVPLLIAAVLLIMGVVAGGALLYSQRRHTIDQFQETARTVNGVIKGSLEHDMLTGDRANLQQALEAIGGNQFIDKASVLLPSGAVVASSKLQEIGKTSGTAQLPAILNDKATHSGFETLEGQNIFREIGPILNEPACQNCHAPAQSVLGAIEVTLDTSSLARHMQEETVLVALMGVMTFVLVGGSLGIMLRRTVLNRISALADTAQRLSRGDYTARSPTKSADELGQLASAFNEMAANVEERRHEIEESHRQLARWNTELEERVRRRTAELSAMNMVLSTLSQSLDPYRMLTEALGQVMGVMQIESGALYSIRPEDNSLIEVTALGPPLSGVKSFAGQEPEEIARQVAASHEPKGATDKNATSEWTGLRSLAFLPMGSPKTIGVLALASTDPGKFDSDRVRLLTSMCDAIGIAMEKASTARAVEDANKIREQLLKKLISAQEEERRRIARDLHDEASQSLAAVAINLEDVANTLPARYKDVRERLATLKERMVSTLSDIRGLALELRPSALDDLGLPAAVDWYAKEYLKKRGLEVSVEITGNRQKLASHTETMIFRIVQEALTNIVRHAEATKVGVHLEFDETKVILRVEDNGKGFDVGAAMARQGMRENLGLYGMTERATLLGGALTIRSKPGQGTALLVEVPQEGRDER